MPHSDEKLLRMAKAGDKQAFTEIYDRYGDRILGYLYRYVGDYHKAQDLTSETFIKLYYNLRSYEERGNFAAYLYRIATNCARNELRKHEEKRFVSLEQTVAGDDKEIKLGDLLTDGKSSPVDDAQRKDLKELVYRAICTLDPKYKEALILCDAEGLTYREAAVILKTNTMTVKTRVHRGRAMLYKLLKKYDKDL